MREFTQAYVSTFHTFGKSLGEYCAILTVLGTIVLIVLLFAVAGICLYDYFFRRASGK